MTKATSDSQLEKWRNKFGGISLWPAPVLGIVLLQFLAALPGSSFGSGVASAQKAVVKKSTQAHQICDRLLAATMDGTTAGGRELELSNEARKFLALIEVGFGNLGPELSKLLKSLGQVARVSEPMNPFLNLDSALGLALSAQAEPLVQDLGGEWNVISSIIAQRTRSGAEQQSQRQTDEEDTRRFSAFVDVVIPADVRPPDLEKLYYIGETPQVIIFGTDEGSSPAGRNAYGRIFRVAKDTHEVRMIYRVQMPDWRLRHVKTQWMHQGLVYGFGHQHYPMPSRGNDEPQIFRLDPETQQIDWAEEWVRPWFRRPPYRFAYRVDEGNSIVGIESTDPMRAIGEVFLFDYNRLQFVPTGLVFDETKHPLFPGTEIDMAIKFLNQYLDDPQKGYLWIGRFFKTDGRTIAARGGSAEWKHWSALEAIQSEKNPDPNSSANLQLREAGSPKPRPAIPVKVVDSFPSETIISVDGSKGILYLAAGDKSMSPTLLLIDRDSWTATDAVVVGGPPRDTNAKWSLDRNQTGDVFLRMDLSHEVAIWKFDPLSKQFELQLQQTFEGVDVDPGAIALIDLEKFKLIAWVYSDIRVGQGLKVWLPVTLERKSSSSEDKSNDLH